MNFKPLISERETDELIQIANYPDHWNPEAGLQAKKELANRNVSLEYQNKKVAVWDRYNQKKTEITRKRRGKEGYNWLKFIFFPHEVLLEMLFDGDLKEDGYVRKHRQRKYTLTIFALLIVLVYVIFKLNS